MSMKTMTCPRSFFSISNRFGCKEQVLKLFLFLLVHFYTKALSVENNNHNTANWRGES